MVIEDVMARTNLCTRRLREADRVDCAPVELAIDVWLSHWLKPHDRLLVILHVLVENFGIGWSQVLLVHNTRFVQRSILHVVGGIWLVKGVKADNIRISCEALRCGIPEGNKLIVHSLVVIE